MTMAGKKPQKQILRETIDAVIEAGFRKGGVLIEMKRRGYEPYTTWRNGHPVGICWIEIATGRRYPGARLGTEYGGKQFFNRIGGLHGESSNRPIVDPTKLKPYDHKQRWENILRNLERGNRPLAGSFSRSNGTDSPRG